MGASSLNRKMKTFRNQGSTPFAINHMKKHVNYGSCHFESFEAPRLYADSLLLKRKLHDKSVMGLNGNQQNPPKRDYPSKLLD